MNTFKLPEVRPVDPMKSFPIPKFVSLDIEGLGFGPYCSIVEIGISLFQESGPLTYSEKIVPDFDRAEKATLDWWETQEGGEEYLQSCEDEGSPTLSKAMDKLGNLFGVEGDNMKALPWYFRGPAYDQALIQHQLSIISEKFTWAHYNCLCQRSVEKEILDLGFDREDIYREANAYLYPSSTPDERHRPLYVQPRTKVAHRAGDDAFHQGVSILGCKALMHRMFRAYRNPSAHRIVTDIKQDIVTCYECDKEVLHLFDDSRCGQCTRLTPEEVKTSHSVVERDRVEDINFIGREADITTCAAGNYRMGTDMWEWDGSRLIGDEMLLPPAEGKIRIEIEPEKGQPVTITSNDQVTSETVFLD